MYGLLQFPAPTQFSKQVKGIFLAKIQPSLWSVDPFLLQLSSSIRAEKLSEAFKFTYSSSCNPEPILK